MAKKSVKKTQKNKTTSVVAGEDKSSLLVRHMSYTFRRNLGDYEHEELTVAIEVNDGDDITQKVTELKDLVVGNLGTRRQNEEQETEKKSRKKKEKVVDEEEESEEDESDSEEESSSKKTKSKKKGRSKSTTYDREDDLHKKLVGEMLDDNFPKWDKKKSLKKLAIKASKSMQGEDFLDSDGDILEDFQEKFLEQMEG